MSIIDSSFFYEEARGGGRSEEQTLCLICLSEKAFDAVNPRVKKKARIRSMSQHVVRNSGKKSLWGHDKTVV